MTNGDMRYGHCGVCGAQEVFRGEYGAQASGIRGTTSFAGKSISFDAYVCASCGHTQFHARLDSQMVNYFHRKLQWIPPYQGTDDTP